MIDAMFYETAEQMDIPESIRDMVVTYALQDYQDLSGEEIHLALEQAWDAVMDGMDSE